MTGDLMNAMNESCRLTKKHVRKTAVLGVTGIKKKLGDLPSKLTDQPLQHFENEEDAKNRLLTST